jgi:hypothetical protein
VSDGLGKAGRGLWEKVTEQVPDGYELDALEAERLLRACQCADDLERLDAVVAKDGAMQTGSRGQMRVHPALAEARALRSVMQRFLAGIKLAEPDDEANDTPGQRQARRAARARWERHNRNAARRAVS